MLEEIIISIPRMNCNGCLKKVTTILQSLPDVTILASDLVAKTIQLSYRSEHISITQIQTALEEARYPIGNILEPVQEAMHAVDA